MELAALVDVSKQVGGTRSRLAKRDLLAALLREVPADELVIASAYLSGALTQRRTGVGWRSLSALPSPAPVASLTLREIDDALEEIAAIGGAGSSAARSAAINELFAALTSDEQEYLRALMTGGIRQGALDAVLLEAIAGAADVPLAAVRRAAMFSAPTGPIAVAALTGGEGALAAFTLVAGRPVRPMLASSAPDVVGAVEKVDGPFVVDTKLDGIRIQVHKQGPDVRIFTRSLDEIADRLPAVVEAVRGLAAHTLILDGEALLVGADGRPRPFQETASGTAGHGGDAALRPYFFDILLDEDTPLIDEPLGTRLEHLDRVTTPAQRIDRLVTADPDAASSFFAGAIAAGQEGIIVKRLDSAYDAGRRGAAWVKVKPRHTLDLVVLAVEWGSGRRRGLLSNIHLGARDPEGGFVMLGKTFKGMTDEMLAWQTERFLSLETSRDGHVVHLRPEQVVEIAFDGLQRSRRYPGGVALRFARVLRYRDDKTAAEADTIETVREFLV